MGVTNLVLFDPDAVNVENLAPQGYAVDDLGKPKVEATAQVCRQCHPEIHLQTHAERFRRSTARKVEVDRLVVFACVDAIAVRQLIWESLHRQAAFFVDGRMSAEVIRVLASGKPSDDDYYSTTLFRPESAYLGSCTAKSTIYTASIAAGLMIRQFTKWLRHLPVDRDVALNLLAGELTIG
jgi:sulfur carrier protein ThiS adenylyltransferase